MPDYSAPQKSEPGTTNPHIPKSQQHYINRYISGWSNRCLVQLLVEYKQLSTIHDGTDQNFPKRYTAHIPHDSSSLAPSYNPSSDRR
uniref:Uncharacterized protein n=1 Tax=Arundo donax TaxID=35708 RepID=A0A0A9NGL9_ARUDO